MQGLAILAGLVAVVVAEVFILRKRRAKKRDDKADEIPTTPGL